MEQFGENNSTRRQIQTKRRGKVQGTVRHVVEGKENVIRCIKEVLNKKGKEKR